MEIFLIKDIDGLGKAGTFADVSSELEANALIAGGKAVNSDDHKAIFRFRHESAKRKLAMMTLIERMNCIKNCCRHLERLSIKNHNILGDLDIDLINPKTGKPYLMIAFAGENGCGKTTLLNEIFNYDFSTYIIKDGDNASLSKNRKIAFLRQGQMYYSAMDNIKKLINGEKPSYPSASKGADSYIKERRNKHPDLPLKVSDLSIFDDEVLQELFSPNHKPVNFIPGGSVSKMIDGVEGDDEYDKYSSGQRELIFKLQVLAEVDSPDLILLDEPETSLHPRWQKKIIDYVLSYSVPIEEDGEIFVSEPQLFIATHSERILESILKHENSLIVRLFRDDNKKIQYETISNMNLILPRISFAELDYLIFKIDSYEYCSELYDLIEWRTNKKERAIDTLIRTSSFYDEKIHYKEWYNDLKQDVTSRNIASYCRNYFHHPKGREEPTDDQLHLAIELLRNVILNLE